MINQTLSDIFRRDLEKLRSEIEQYASDDDLWKKPDNIPNSGGNLALHLIGNLNHFIGAVLGGSGYVRDRDSEFSSSEISRKTIIDKIDSVARTVEQTLATLPEEVLAREFPVRVFDRPDSTEWMLVHLISHFNYHLGQINYHRRLISQ